MVLICASDCEESSPGSSRSSSALPSREVRRCSRCASCPSCSGRARHRWHFARRAVRLAWPVAALPCGASDSPASSSTICVQSSRKGTCSSRGYRLRSSAQFLEIGGRTKNHGGVWTRETRAHPTSVASFSGPTTMRSQSVQVRILPQIAGDHGKARQLPLGLPARRQQTSEFGVIGENQYAWSFRKGSPLPDCCVAPARKRQQGIKVFRLRPAPKAGA